MLTLRFGRSFLKFMQGIRLRLSVSPSTHRGKAISPRGRKGMREAMEALDLAIESLYPHTQFHKMGHQLYRRVLEGTITLKHWCGNWA